MTGFSHHPLSLATLGEDLFILLFFGEELLLAVHYWIVLISETYFSLFFFFNVKTLPCSVSRYKISPISAMTQFSYSFLGKDF